jgi:hypothetical protein
VDVSHLATFERLTAALKRAHADMAEADAASMNAAKASRQCHDAYDVAWHNMETFIKGITR